MIWNWEHSDWPQFRYDAECIAELEKEFFQLAGGSIVLLKNLAPEKRHAFVVDLLCLEGVTSAKIEGELLERESLQASLLGQFGLLETRKKVKIPPKEKGMSHLLSLVYQDFDEILSHQNLKAWHAALFPEGSNYLGHVGSYRTGEEPMQIVSSDYYSRESSVHFEAPPAQKLQKEMTHFIGWFNESGNKHGSALARAAIAHVYFESIHPFEDGNGRIGRALAEKALSQSLGYAIPVALSYVIDRNRKQYYKALASCNRSLDATLWVSYFADLAVQAMSENLDWVQFLFAKAQLMSRLSGQINPRQEKALLRMFDEGPAGFEGGLSAEKYIAITRATRPTATRDLADLLKKGALIKKGELKHTRYFLKIPFSAGI